MTRDLYRLAIPARDVMFAELDRILAARPVDPREADLQCLAIQLSCVIGAFATSGGRSRAETAAIVHGALGNVIATVAHNMRVHVSDAPPSLASSWNATILAVAARGIAAIGADEAGMTDSVVPMEVGSDGLLHPKPFDVIEMLKRGDA